MRSSGGLKSKSSQFFLLSHALSKPKTGGVANVRIASKDRTPSIVVIQSFSCSPSELIPATNYVQVFGTKVRNLPNNIIRKLKSEFYPKHYSTVTPDDG